MIRVTARLHETNLLIQLTEILSTFAIVALCSTEHGRIAFLVAYVAKDLYVSPISRVNTFVHCDMAERMNWLISGQRISGVMPRDMRPLMLDARS